MRIAFFGSGAFGLPTLKQLAAQHELVAVVTQPDRRAGRGRQLQPTPVGQWALEQPGLDLHRSDNVNASEFVEMIRSLKPDASVVIAFGQKLGEPLIEAMGELAVNLHASLLPQYRGAAPINWAMMEGDSVSGVCVIALAQRMDAGAIYGSVKTEILPDETAGELHDRLAELGPEAVLGVLDDLGRGTLSPVEQDESRATKAPKLNKAMGTTGFEQEAALVRGRVNGLTPWPGCRVLWTRGGETLGELTLKRVRDEAAGGMDSALEPGTIGDDLLVACGSGVLRVLEAQVPGGRALPFEELARGQRIQPGDRLVRWPTEK